MVAPRSTVRCWLYGGYAAVQCSPRPGKVAKKCAGAATAQPPQARLTSPRAAKPSRRRARALGGGSEGFTRVIVRAQHLLRGRDDVRVGHPGDRLAQPAL